MLFFALIVLAVVLGLVYEKPMYSVVFGGMSAASLVTVVLWKPYEMTFGATIVIQRLEMILVALEQEWKTSQDIVDPKDRAKRVADANKAALGEMAKLGTQKA